MRAAANCTNKKAIVHLVHRGVPRIVRATRVDPAAVKPEEAIEEDPKTCEHYCACADPPEDVGTQRAPEPKAEEDDQDPGEVGPNLVLDPRLVRGQRAEVGGSVVCGPVSVGLRERGPM
jgi:hypothetical protein